MMLILTPFVAASGAENSNFDCVPFEPAIERTCSSWACILNLINDQLSVYQITSFRRQSTMVPEPPADSMIFDKSSVRGMIVICETFTQEARSPSRTLLGVLLGEGTEQEVHDAVFPDDYAAVFASHWKEDTCLPELPLKWTNSSKVEPSVAFTMGSAATATSRVVKGSSREGSSKVWQDANILWEDARVKFESQVNRD